MKFIDQTVFNTINKQLDWDLIDLKIEVEEHQKRRNDYLNQKEEGKLNLKFITDKKRSNDANQIFNSIINEYVNLIDELKDNLKKVQNLGKLPEDYQEKEEELFNLRERINEIKTELKQKSPSYASAQQKLQDAKNAKFYQPIINK